jgi:hypothetical protein
MVNSLNTYSNPFQTQAGQPQLYYAMPVRVVPLPPTPPATTPSNNYGAQNPQQAGDGSIISNLLNTIHMLTSSLMKFTGGKSPYGSPDCSVNNPTDDTSGEEEGTSDPTGDSTQTPGDLIPQHTVPKKIGHHRSGLKNPFGDPNDPNNIKSESTIAATDPKLVRLNNIRAAQALASIRGAYPSETTYDDPFLKQVEKDHSEDNLRHAAEILLGDNNETGARSALKKLYGKDGSVSIDDINDFTLRYNPDEINPANASGTADDKKAATALTTLTGAYKSKQAGWDDDFLRSVVVENSNITSKYSNAAKVLLGFDDNGNARTSWVNLLNNGVTDRDAINNFIKQANQT